MRGATLLVAVAGAITLLMGTMSPAKAWYDRWGRWHPNRPYYSGYYYRPPPPVYYAPRPYYYRPPPPVYGYGGPGITVHIP